MPKELIIPSEIILNKILLLRGYKVMLDRDIAELFGVSTKRLNEQVKRNLIRFPSHFMFELTKDEKDEVVAKCDHQNNLEMLSCHFKMIPNNFIVKY